MRGGFAQNAPVDERFTFLTGSLCVGTIDPGALHLRIVIIAQDTCLEAAMRVIESIRRSAVGVEPDCTVQKAAEIMNQARLGALAVVDGEQLLGIVTDRDLVRRGLARRVPTDARVDALMSTPVITIEAEADVHEAFAVFRSHAIRRLAIVRGDKFVGMITIDDLLINLAADLADLARPITAEVIFGHRDPPVPVHS